MRRGILVSVIASLILTLPVSAGDGGTVRVDAPPTTAVAGQLLHLGFVVYSHGQPIDAFGEQPVRPYLSATNDATGGFQRVTAHKDGAIGRFAVDVTLPSAGEWRFVIKAEPLALGTWSGALTVTPAVAPTAAPQPVGTRATGVVAGGGSLFPPFVWGLGVLALGAVGALLPPIRRGITRRVRSIHR